MNRIFLAEARDDELKLLLIGSRQLIAETLPVVGLEPHFDSRTDIVIISRLDYEMHNIQVPPVPHRELDGIVGFKLRPLYPAAPDQTVFDFINYDLAADLHKAVVYVMRSDVFSLYQLLAESGILISSDLLCRSERPDQRNTQTLFLFPRYAEVLIPDEEGLLSSTLFSFDKNSWEPVELVHRILPLFASHARNTIVSGPFSETEKGTELVRILRDAGISVDDFRPVTALFQPHRIARLPRLFEPTDKRRRRNAGRFRSLLLGTLMFLSILLFALYGFRTVNGYEKQLLAIQIEYDDSQRHLAQTAQQMRELLSAQTELKSLIALRPKDIYGFFSHVAASASPQMTIRDLTLNGNTFTLSGEISGSAASESAFAFSERLAADKRFQNVQIIQLVPDPISGAVQVTIAGAYHG